MMIAQFVINDCEKYEKSEIEMSEMFEPKIEKTDIKRKRIRKRMFVSAPYTKDEYYRFYQRVSELDDQEVEWHKNDYNSYNDKYRVNHVPLYSDHTKKCLHPDCGKELVNCTDCSYVLCMSTTPNCLDVYKKTLKRKMHFYCRECNKNLTCHLSGICFECSDTQCFHMITDHIAIGNCDTSYEPFDIIVDINYPENGAPGGEIVVIYPEYPKNQTIIRCGFHDMAGGSGMKRENFEKILNLIEDNKKNNDKILFHCFAGVSRSSTTAILYLSKTLGITTQEAFDMAKQKRQMILPNKGFQQILGIVIPKDTRIEY